MRGLEENLSEVPLYFCLHRTILKYVNNRDNSNLMALISHGILRYPSRYKIFGRWTVNATPSPLRQIFEKNTPFQTFAAEAPLLLTL